MFSKANWPLSLELAVRVKLVSGFVRVTVAPGTTAPAGSLIEPLIAEVPWPWPKALPQKSISTTSVPSESINLYLVKLLLFIDSSAGRFFFGFGDLAAELLERESKVSRIPALQLRLCCSGNRDRWSSAPLIGKEFELTGQAQLQIKPDKADEAESPTNTNCCFELALAAIIPRRNATPQIGNLLIFADK
jgi:hypothetical protein